MFGLLIYSLTSLVLSLLVHNGLIFRRRLFLLPYMIFLALVMILLVLAMPPIRFYLLLLPLGCMLAVVSQTCQ